MLSDLHFAYGGLMSNCESSSFDELRVAPTTMALGVMTRLEESGR